MVDESAGLPTTLIDAAMQMLGRGRIPIVGNSMRPGLHEGDEVLIAFSTDGLRRGEILLFRQRDYLVVHRLLGRGRGGWRTRGDARNELDPWVAPERVLGRAIAQRRGERWWSLEGPGASLYRQGMAWHGLFWWAAGVVASWPQRLLRRVGIRLPLRAGVAAIDRLQARLAHALLFRLLHRRCPEPPQSG